MIYAKPVKRMTMKYRISRAERGQVVILVCVALFAIMGFVAMVTDLGFMQHQKNMMQTAADSAAMAAAMELNYGDSVTAGKTDAATNGFTDGQSSVTVAINSPPSSGPNSSKTGFIEAIVSKPEPTYFLRVLGFTSINVSARAVASEGNGPNCIYVMDPSASPALSVNGNVNINSSCGLLVDSSSSSAMTFIGNDTVTAPTIGVVGGYTSGSNVTLSPTPKTGGIAASDPLAYIQAPSTSGCDHTSLAFNGNTGTISNPYQLYPGTYCGGISVNGNAFLHFNPGTYVLSGSGFKVGGNAVMSGTGVTFYNTGGLGGYQAIALDGNATSNFSAPTSGPLGGILFFQDRSIPSSAPGSTISGDTGSTFDGAMYFPTTLLTLSGNSSVGGYGIVVADKLVVSGNSTLGNNYSSLADGSPIKGTMLAE